MEYRPGCGKPRAGTRRRGDAEVAEKEPRSRRGVCGALDVPLRALRRCDFALQPEWLMKQKAVRGEGPRRTGGTPVPPKTTRHTGLETGATKGSKTAKAVLTVMLRMTSLPERERRGEGRRRYSPGMYEMVPSQGDEAEA